MPAPRPFAQNMAFVSETDVGFHACLYGRDAFNTAFHSACRLRIERSERNGEKKDWDNRGELKYNGLYTSMLYSSIDYY